MKTQPREMIEGPEAFQRFQDAMKKLVSTPKSAMPPSPFKKSAPNKPRGGEEKTPNA